MDLSQYLHDVGSLLGSYGRREIDHVQQQDGGSDFFQSGPEGIYQSGG